MAARVYLQHSPHQKSKEMSMSHKILKYTCMVMGKIYIDQSLQFNPQGHRVDNPATEKNHGHPDNSANSYCDSPTTPSDTLFVFDLGEHTTEHEDVLMFFEPYGCCCRVDVNRNYAFVQFSTIEEATRARCDLDGRYLDGRKVTVEYVVKCSGDPCKYKRYVANKSKW
jgi:hypothetical protein